MKTLNPANAALITADRKRTNFLKEIEQEAILFFCEVMPSWVTPDMLTFVALLGSLTVFMGFWLARTDPNFLLVSIAGFAIQWFGDSLDGRLAYFRKTPRKWYGFSLDLSMDWISTILMGLGFYFYLPADFRIFVFVFVTAYGWSMILTLLKYKITDSYSIDNVYLGPTEVRIVLCMVLLAEIVCPGSIQIFAVMVNVILIIIDLIMFYQLLQAGNKRDRLENGK